MTVHLIQQLRFSRSEFIRCLQGLGEEDGRKRLPPMNSISWMVGHLANQENAYWVSAGQGKEIIPGLNKLVGYGQPASTPPLAEMWSVWQEATKTADLFLDQLKPDDLTTTLLRGGKPLRETVGTMLLRNIYHYWFHCGEAHAVRQMLGHADLPQFVGDMSEALYRGD
jgi:hypothetical protein